MYKFLSMLYKFDMLMQLLPRHARWPSRASTHYYMTIYRFQRCQDPCLKVCCFKFRLYRYMEVLASGVKFDAPMEETYAVLGMDESETTSLEDYLEEYFSKILKKLKEVGGQSRQKDFYL
jgi:hypothetical protein